MASSIEFVRIGGYPVKVTSLARDSTSGGYTLVVITRGSADRNHLNNLLAATPLDFEVPRALRTRMRVDGIDARSVGEGERVITRFSIRLEPDDPTAERCDAEDAGPPSIEDRLDAIERKLDQALDALAARASQPAQTRSKRR